MYTTKREERSCVVFGPILIEGNLECPQTHYAITENSAVPGYFPRLPNDVASKSSNTSVSELPRGEAFLNRLLLNQK